MKPVKKSQHTGISASWLLSMADIPARLGSLFCSFANSMYKS